MAEETVIEWHNDGHSINIMLQKSVFVIDSVYCPNSGKDGDCFSDVLGGCFVEWFLNRYGFECNVGVVPAAPNLEIAWTRVMESPHDPEMWQVWVIPSTDEVFAAWMQAQNGSSSDS